jgi:hypothetical protein
MDDALDTAPISLRPLADGNSENEDLKTVIARMHKKYGGFRHVTEEMLEKEIEDEIAGNNGYSEQDDDEADLDKGTPEYIAEKKASMVQQLGYEMSLRVPP